MADSANPIKRILNPDSPIYVPILMNSLFILIFGIFYLYNLSDLPSVEQLDKIVKSYSEPQKQVVSQKSPINIAAIALSKGALNLAPFQGPTGVAAAALAKAATTAAKTTAAATAAATAALAKAATGLQQQRQR